MEGRRAWVLDLGKAYVEHIEPKTLQEVAWSDLTQSSEPGSLVALQLHENTLLVHNPYTHPDVQTCSISSRVTELWDTVLAWCA